MFGRAQPAQTPPTLHQLRKSYNYLNSFDKECVISKGFSYASRTKTPFLGPLTSLLQRAQRLADLAEVISGMHHNRQSASNGSLIIPIWKCAQHGADALICFPQFVLK